MSTTNTLPPRPTTTKPDFDFPKKPKDLPTPEESTTNSTTTIIPPKFTQIEIEEHLKNHIKNSLSEDLI
ncbi:hypothetical protein C2G38_2165272 [Gigaspora rosea]|uniref:Uncharacterized protein n=1 Tax=Gigaspora rosea TaxID=44941 RepID=A0A397VUR2_9GLOM|nr:hypothetical protein C2G38_2165272 [Gigaspora rosea]